MRLGLVTDIHCHVAELKRALAEFHARKVDKVVNLGDACDAFKNWDAFAEVASLLSAAGAVGVWGNHDYSLCRNVSPAARRRHPDTTLAFMAGMEPRLVIGECHFSHKESPIDPWDMLQLWDDGEMPKQLSAKAKLAFGAGDWRWQFVGHYHQWWAESERGPTGWAGAGPLSLEPGIRYFVVVSPVCQGHCAVLDTEIGLLEPIQCGTIEAD